jgi:hypothetical protein
LVFIVAPFIALARSWRAADALTSGQSRGVAAGSYGLLVGERLDGLQPRGTRP